MEIYDKLIYESTVKIVKPIAQQITNRLLKYLNLKNILGDEIYFKDLTEASSNTQTTDHKPKINTNRCDVTMTSQHDPKDIKWNSFDFNHTSSQGLSSNTMRKQFPLFGDKRNNIYLYEYSIPHRLKLDFDIKLANIELIDIAMASIYNKFSTVGIIKYNDLQFKYPLPDIMLLMLHKLFGLKENTVDMTFKEYIDVGSSSRISIIVNRDNLNQKQLNILKSHVFSLGEVEYNYETPDAEKKNQLSNRYSIPFSYTIEFLKPSMLRLMYPIVIDNKPIPKEYIMEEDKNKVLQKDSVYHFPSIIFNKYHEAQDASYEEIYGKYEVVKYPSYDKWIPPYKSRRSLNKYLPIFQGVISISTDTIGNYLTLDIKEDILPLLPETTANFIEETLIYQGNHSKYDYSLLNISVFKDDYILREDKFEINDSFQVFTRDNIIINSIYRVVIGVAVDFSWVNREYIIYGLSQHEYMNYIIIRNAEMLIREQYVTLEEANTGKMTSSGFEINLDDKIILEDNGGLYGLNGTFRVGRFVITPIKFIK